MSDTPVTPFSPRCKFNHDWHDNGRNIVICSDGTWMAPEKSGRDDVTNVLRIARGIAAHGKNGKAQQVFYDAGIGTGVFKFLNGITGIGLHKNVQDCYRYIVQNYEPGDRLFFFGFSRGAYTVRALCGMIYNVGILKRPYACEIAFAFKLFLKNDPEHAADSDIATRFRSKYSHCDSQGKPIQDVYFVGAYDTVGSLSFMHKLRSRLRGTDELLDKKVVPNIKHVRHALALDEHRRVFPPTVCYEHGDVQQVWFAGVHSDIGGGNDFYEDPKLDEEDGRAVDYPKYVSDVALRWMVGEACSCGLIVEKDLCKYIGPEVDERAPLEPLHKSRTGIFRLWPNYDRKINHTEGSQPLFHASLMKRHLETDYNPAHLRKYLETVGGTQAEAWDTLKRNGQIVSSQEAISESLVITQITKCLTEVVEEVKSSRDVNRLQMELDVACATLPSFNQAVCDAQELLDELSSSDGHGGGGSKAGGAN